MPAAFVWVSDLSGTVAADIPLAVMLGTIIDIEALTFQRAKSCCPKCPLAYFPISPAAWPLS